MARAWEGVLKQRMLTTQCTIQRPLGPTALAVRVLLLRVHVLLVLVLVLVLVLERVVVAAVTLGVAAVVLGVAAVVLVGLVVGHRTLRQWCTLGCKPMLTCRLTGGTTVRLPMR
jgi:hypothetical protein